MDLLGIKEAKSEYYELIKRTVMPLLMNEQVIERVW